MLSTISSTPSGSGDRRAGGPQSRIWSGRAISKQPHPLSEHSSAALGISAARRSHPVVKRNGEWSHQGQAAAAVHQVIHLNHAGCRAWS